MPQGFGHPRPLYGNTPLHPAGYQVYGTYPAQFGSTSYQQFPVSGHNQPTSTFYPWYGSIQTSPAYWSSSPPGATGWPTAAPAR